MERNVRNVGPSESTCFRIGYHARDLVEDLKAWGVTHAEVRIDHDGIPYVTLPTEHAAALEADWSDPEKPGDKYGWRLSLRTWAPDASALWGEIEIGDLMRPNEAVGIIAHQYMNMQRTMAPRKTLEAAL